MFDNKIVARYKDGRIVKGTTTNFSPECTHFTVLQADGEGESLMVETGLLKAVFFVRDFVGNPRHQKGKHLVPGQPYQGRPIEVTFNDGEMLVGSAPTYGPEMAGFFVFPADREGNTIKAYVVASSVRQVRWVAIPKPALANK